MKDAEATVVVERLDLDLMTQALEADSLIEGYVASFDRRVTLTP